MNDPTSSLSSSFHAALPSSSSIGDFWPESQQFVALPHDLQRTVASHTSAIYVGYCLLLALLDVVHPQTGKSASSVSFQHYLPWVLDSCLALWQHFKRWTISSDRHLLYDETIVLYMQVLDSVAFPTTMPEGCFSEVPKAAQFLATSLVDLLDRFSASPLSDPTQIQFASMFTRLRSILNASSSQESAHLRRKDATKSIILIDLEASVAKICQNVEQFSVLHGDLQVRVTPPFCIMS